MTFIQSHLTECILGATFGRWTVREADWARKVLCRCSCGVERLVSSKNLRSGRSTSCGCLTRENARAALLTHGETAGIGNAQSREYRALAAAKTRCGNPSYRAFHRYGGRGIVVCERWRSNFSAFLEDMGRCPPGMSLERIDCNGNYEPSNCRWATPTEQNRNRCNSLIVTFRGAVMHVNDAAAAMGISGSRLYRLIRKFGWTVQEVEASLAQRRIPCHPA